MKYTEVKITTSDYGIEKITGALFALGIEETIVDSNSTAIEIFEKKNEYEWDYVDENFFDDSKEPTITFYLNEDICGQELYEQVSSMVEEYKKLSDVLMGSLEIIKRTVDDEEWMNSYKDHFKTIDLTDSIIVKPSWEEVSENNRKKVLKLDPGMAFGTGDHATTSMCAVLMEECGCKDKNVLDVGTGSGILSIVADMLGGKNILGIDIDPTAVEVAIENGRNNNCGENVKFAQGDLTNGIDFVGDMVVGNLMAEIVVILTNAVKRHLKPGGVFIASGILTEKKDKVIEAMLAEGLEVIRIMEGGEWVAIAAKHYE